MTTVVHRAFEHLARVAVFINQARIGEALAVNEPVSFENDFERIEDHHRDGLYWLLCAIQTAVGRTSRPTIEPEVADAILRMRVVAVDRNSMRHTRDYLVLRDFERLLNRLSIEFAELGRLSSSSMSTLVDNSSIEEEEEEEEEEANEDDGTGSGTSGASGSGSSRSHTENVADHEADRDDRVHKVRHDHDDDHTDSQGYDDHVH